MVDKRFCSTTTKAYVWEAFAFRMWKTYESFDKANPPYVLATAIGGDGIILVEQKKDRSIVRCRYYEDRAVPYEMRYQNPDTFADNQWAEKMQSWGPNGAILPWVNSSSDWRSLFDESKIGIICLYNEIWIGTYSWTAGSGANYNQNYFEILFRPREINKSDLIMILVQEQCKRKCMPQNVNEYPCITSGGDCGKVPIPQYEDVKDDDIIELPHGNVTGKDYKAKYEDRSTYVKPCVTVCKENGTPSDKVFVTNEELNVKLVNEPVKVATDNALPIQGAVFVNNKTSVPVLVEGSRITVPVRIPPENPLPPVSVSGTVPVNVTQAIAMNIASPIETSIVQKAGECFRVCSSVNKVMLKDKLIVYINSIIEILRNTCSDPTLPCSVRDELIVYLNSVVNFVNNIVNEGGINLFRHGVQNIIQNIGDETVKRKFAFISVGFYYICLNIYGNSNVEKKDVFLTILNDDKIKDIGILVEHIFESDEKFWTNLDSSLKSEFFQEKPRNVDESGRDRTPEPTSGDSTQPMDTDGEVGESSSETAEK